METTSLKNDKSHFQENTLCLLCFFWGVGPACLTSMCSEQFHHITLHEKLGFSELYNSVTSHSHLESSAALKQDHSTQHLMGKT